MAIQSHGPGEDVLAQLGDVPEDLEAHWDSVTTAAAIDEDIHGSFGFHGIGELLWDISDVYDSATLTIKVAGMTVGKWVLDKAHTSVDIHLRPTWLGPVGYALKFALGIVADWGAKKLTLSGKACCWAPFSWHCLSYDDLTLIHW